LLHFEQEPGLFPLVSDLRERGYIVESAWPLASYLHGLPDEWTDSGAVTVVAVDSNRACAYSHPAHGTRSILTWRDDNVPAQVGAWLRTVLAKNPDEPILVVATNDEALSALSVEASLQDRSAVQQMGLADALARRVVLPRHHPAQLLPAVPIATLQFAAIAASFALFAMAAWWGTAYARDCLAWRSEGEAREAQRTALRAEVSHLRANAADITALRASLPAAGPGVPLGALLLQFAATIPPEVVLGALRVTPEGFTANGYISPAAPAGLWEGWTAVLAPTGGPFVLHTNQPIAGAFSLRGEFTR
jgi:hypothetical protein